jgi:predicted HicB family RNase H-like nuclease
MKMDLKKLASRYIKIVEWSEEDNCYVGRCPELFSGGTHGNDETKVYAELCAIVEEVVADRLAEGKKPPVPLKYSGKFLLRTGPALHQALAVRARREGKSLNQVCIEAFQG